MRIMRLLSLIILISLIFMTSQSTIDAQDGQQTEPLQVLGKYGGLADFAWSPDSSILAVSTYTGIVLYDQTLNEVGFLKPTDEIGITGGLSWSPDGTLLVSLNSLMRPSGKMNKEAYVWNVASGEIIYTYRLDDGIRARSPLWNLAGDTVLFTLSDTAAMQSLILWDMGTGNVQEIGLGELSLQPDTQWTWTDDEQRLVTTVREEQISISVADPSQIEQTSITPPDKSIYMSPDNSQQAILDDGVFMITNSNGQQFELAGDEVGRFKGFSDLVWAENSKRVAVWGRGPVPNLMVADVLTGEVLLEFTYGHVGSVIEAKLSPDGSVIAIRTFVDELIVYDLDTAEQAQRMFRGVSTSVSFSPDGTKLASVNASTQHVYLWDTATGEELEVWETPNDPKGIVNNIFTVAWSPDGKYVATGSVGGGQVTGDTESRPIDLFIWSAETGEVVQVIPALAYDADIIAELEWSADSQILAYSTHSNLTGNSHIGVYNLQTHELNFQAPLEIGVWDIALHPDGDVLALTVLNIDNPNEQQIIFVDARTGELLDVRTPAIDATLRSIDWHPSGDYFAVLLDNQDVPQVQIWSWQVDAPLGFYMFFDLEGEGGRSSLEWNNQGTQLATWYFGDDNAFGVQIWDIGLEGSTATLSTIFLPTYPDYFLPFPSFDALDWSNDGMLIATSLSNFTSSIWDVPTE